ncbi:MAG: hypothetical protein AB8H86_00660 [Polyangiales bacterium]
MADENEKEPIETDEEENLEETDTDETSEDEAEYEDDSEEEDDDSEEEEEEESSASSKKAAAAAAAAAAVAKRKKTGRKKKAPKETAGQRLARAKKLKADRKAAERQIEDEVVEEAAIEQAEVAASFLEKNQKSIVMGMVGIAVAAALFFGYQKFAEGATAESSAALWAAVSTANAEVVAEEDAAADASDAPERETYETIRARAEAALEKFRGVQSDFPGSDAATYAALGEANALYDTGEFAGAREVYERALSAGQDDVNVAIRATEGIAFTFEAEDNWESAKERYEELKDVDHPQAEPLARLHLARCALHDEDEEAAKTELRTLLENLREEDAPQLPYVRDQAELRLMALDSSLVQRAPDLGGGLQGAPEDLQRQIQELMRQQQEQQGQ